MLNLHPRFFDLSFVFIGADKTSKVLAMLDDRLLCPIQEKTARCKKGCFGKCIPSVHVHEVWSRERAASKQGEREMEKAAASIPGLEQADKDEWASGGSTPDDSAKLLEEAFGIDKKSALDIAKKAEIVKNVRSNFDKELPNMESNEPSIPEDVLKEMSQCPEEALSTAGSLGIVLKPREFQRLIIVARGRPHLADQLDSMGTCFKTGQPPSDFSMGDSIIPAILKLLAPLMGERSCFSTPLHRRVIRITMRVPEKEVGPEIDNKLLDKLSADYSAYRKDLLYKSASLIKSAYHSHPWVAEDVVVNGVEQLFSRGLVKNARNMMESFVGMLSTDYLNRIHMPGPVSEYLDRYYGAEGLVGLEGLAARGRVA